MADTLESKITKLIVEHSMRDWSNMSCVDVVVVGAGPAGLTTAKYVSDAGFKTVVFERRLSFGGGMGGGGMLFHKLVVEEEALEILRDFDVKVENTCEDGLYVVDSFELMSKLAVGAVKSGAKIIHGVTVDDVIYRENPLRVTGVAVQWTAVIMSGLHVDPLFIASKAVVDATGHDAEVLSVVARKIPELELKLYGEKSVCSSVGEREVMDKAGRVIPGLYVAGMAVATLYGTPRMGPIFGGMLVSGRKAAQVIISDIEKESE